MKKCTCGVVVKQGKRWQAHIQSKWHKVHKEAFRMRRMGVPYSHIGRKLGLHRCYVQQQCKAAGL
jgi:hypothetical protein